MRKPPNQFAEQAKELLEKVADQSGWKIEDPEEDLDSAFARVWVTKHVGIQLEARGHFDDRGWKLIVKTCVFGGDGRSDFYSQYARGWRKLVGIEEEDRRSILELAASLPKKEALILAAELRRYEDSMLHKRQREALIERVAAFKAKTGQDLWCNALGPPEAKDEPYEPGYERPAGWLKSLIVQPGSATFIIEVPDQGTDIEAVFKMIKGWQRMKHGDYLDRFITDDHSY